MISFCKKLGLLAESTNKTISRSKPQLQTNTTNVGALERHLFALEGTLKFEERKMRLLQLGHYRYRSRHTFALEKQLEITKENLMSTF